MTEQLSRTVVSNQTGPHERLEQTVRRHLEHTSQKPIAGHTQAAFDHMLDWLDGGKQPLILDACCGVGDSSRNLAEAFPGHRVVGVDKSLKRLTKEREKAEPKNLLLLRADLNDFYRLCVRQRLQVEQHFILYPNPWPKAAHLGRRWHGAPAFADIIALGGKLELRSNWQLYLEEFQLALGIAGVASELNRFSPDGFLTPFEAKYHQSGQALWRLVAHIHSTH